MTSGSASLQPTYHGYVGTTFDALILFEACLTGQLHHVPRRPHDRERSNLIRSGCVFIYEENASGIKRWTDGVPWSPSRILGNFLVYRELTRPFPPGEKKRATKRSKRPSKPGDPYPRPQSDENGAHNGYTSTSPRSANAKGGEGDSDRALIGSLVDSYPFKEDGLVKKTMSVTVNGVHHHLVSYYKLEDVPSGSLETPSAHEALRFVKPRHELVARQNFRAPLDELDEAFDPALDGSRNPYGYGDRHSFDRRPHMGGPGYRPPPGAPSHGGYGFSGVEPLPYPDGTSQQPPPPQQQHPSAVTNGYGASPASAPSGPQAYYPPNGAGHGQSKSEDYGNYAGPYPPRFEPIGPNVGGVPPTQTDRGPPQLQPMNYPQIRARPNGAEVSNMVESKSPDPYNRGYFAPPRPGGGQSPYSASDAQRWDPPSSTPRSDASIPAYQAEKTGYWGVNGGVGVGHGHYPTPPAMTHWNQHASM
ncbi:MAG: hypothetical protein M1837_005822 [Sclerophora amabilis]|nr:MAG: hypothetical protein M1837_005822 [Sclerophora amabilis]